MSFYSSLCCGVCFKGKVNGSNFRFAFVSGTKLGLFWWDFSALQLECCSVECASSRLRVFNRGIWSQIWFLLEILVNGVDPVASWSTNSTQVNTGRVERLDS